MKIILTISTLFLATFFSIAQKPTSYIKSAEEVEGKRTIYSEIIIDASPEVVRAKFLEFEKWSEWNSVIPKISLKTGDLDNLETKPTLDLTLDFSRKNDPAPAPVFPDVYANDEEAFVWGFDRWYLKAHHVHLFEPMDNGTKTRFINYEKMNGLMKSFIMTKKRKANMTAHFIKMNEEFKNICEK